VSEPHTTIENHGQIYFWLDNGGGRESDCSPISKQKSNNPKRGIFIPLSRRNSKGLCKPHNTNKYVGPTEARANRGANLVKPLFMVIIPLLLLLAAITKIPEGVVVGFRIFAWAPK
jgi:hypothetical protein